MTEWEVVSSFLNVLEEQPPAEDFEEGWRELWLPMEKACKNVARHSHVMKTALKQFEKQVSSSFAKDSLLAEMVLDCYYTNDSAKMLFAEAFKDNHEKEQLVALCQDVGLEPTEFLELAFERHKNDCMKSFRKAGI